MSPTLRHAHRALARTRSAGADHSVHRAPSPPYPRPPLPPVPYPALPHHSTHAWRELKALVEKVQHRHAMEVAGRGKGRVRERRISAADEAARRRASHAAEAAGDDARPTHPGVVFDPGVPNTDPSAYADAASKLPASPPPAPYASSPQIVLAASKSMTWNKIFSIVVALGAAASANGVTCSDVLQGHLEITDSVTSIGDVRRPRVAPAPLCRVRRAPRRAVRCAEPPPRARAARPRPGPARPQFAFQSCSSLTSVTIPDSVTSIGYVRRPRVGPAPLCRVRCASRAMRAACDARRAAPSAAPSPRLARAPRPRSYPRARRKRSMGARASRP